MWGEVCTDWGERRSFRDLTMPAHVIEAISHLDDAERHEVVDALLRHATLGEEPTFGGGRMAVYVLARAALDEENDY